MLKILTGFITLIALATGSGASAQGVFDLGPLSSSVQQNGAAIGQPSTPEAQAKAQSVDFTFVVSPPLRAENVRKFVDGLRQQDPAMADQLAGQDLIAMLEPSLNAIGLKTNDLADAYTMWLMSSYALYRDIDEDATPRQVAGTRKLVATTLAGAPDLINAPVAERQKFAEGLILQALVNVWLAESLKQAPDQKPAFQQETLRSAKADMGIDLTRFEYGADGLYAKPQ